jgi:hypothetical protein
MSYDISMQAIVGVPGLNEALRLEGFELNVTYNLSPMFQKALSCKEGLRIFNGERGQDSAFLLELAHSRLQEEEEEFLKLNPPNGWGDYAGAVSTINIMRRWAYEVPGGVFRVA